MQLLSKSNQCADLTDVGVRSYLKKDMLNRISKSSRKSQSLLSALFRDAN